MTEFKSLRHCYKFSLPFSLPTPHPPKELARRLFSWLRSILLVLDISPMAITAFRAQRLRSEVCKEKLHKITVAH